MDFDLIIKVLVYLVIVRIIMSKLNKNKKTRDKEKETPKTPDIPARPRSNNLEPRRKKVKTRITKSVDLNIGIDSLKDLIPKPHKDLGPMARMAEREKELENRNRK